MPTVSFYRLNDVYVIANFGPSNTGSFQAISRAAYAIAIEIGPAATVEDRRVARMARRLLRMWRGAGSAPHPATGRASDV